MHALEHRIDLLGRQVRSATGGQHDLADHAAVLEHPVRLRGLSQWERHVHDGLDPAITEHHDPRRLASDLQARCLREVAGLGDPEQDVARCERGWRARSGRGAR